MVQHVFPAFRFNDVKKIPVPIQPAAESSDSGAARRVIEKQGNFHGADTKKFKI
jgi:hypothetical protein